MWQEILSDYISLRASDEESRLTKSQENLLEDFVDFLDMQRSPTTRAPAEASGARYCPACHALLEERSVYCDNCGTDTPRSGG